MGLFNDNVGQQRLNWEYLYYGKELLPHAMQLLDTLFQQEQAARNKLSDLMRDMTVSNRDTRVQELERDVKSLGVLREQCDVFVHQFIREPGKQFSLGLGDVTFFGLTTPVKAK